MVVVGWLVLELTDSPFVLGLVAACRGVPLLLFGAFGGLLADRLDRRKLLIAAQMVSSLLMFLMAILIATALIQVWQIIVITLLIALMMAISMPARQAFLYDIVGGTHLLNAIALNRIAMDSTRILGSVLGGGLIVLIGTSGCFYLMGISYIAGGAALFMIKRAEKLAAGGQSSVWQNLRDGISYIRSNRTVLLLLATEIIIDTFAFSYYSMLPVFARDVLGVGATGLGFLTGASGAGALLGVLAVGMLGNIKYKGRLLLGSCFAFGVTLILFSVSPWYPLSLALLVIAGGAGAIYDTVLATALQTIVTEGMRGRVLGVYVLTWGMSPLGGLQVGAVANLTGVTFAVAIGGVIVSIYALITASRAPSLRMIE